MTTASLHIVTPEYPPKRGGVADYAAALAAEFVRRGVPVHVRFPCSATQDLSETPAGIALHPLVGGMTLRNIFRLDRRLSRQPKPRRLCVQYVPHGYGWKGMNLPFALWLLRRAYLCGDRIDTMFHEVAYPWVRRPLHHNLVAAVNRLMAVCVAQASTRLFVTIPAWANLLHGYAVRRGRPIAVLPVPSMIPKSVNAAAAAELRTALTSNDAAFVVGHFGTYGSHVGDALRPILLGLLAARGDVCILLLGHNGIPWSEDFLKRHPQFRSRITALGERSAVETADALAACDVVMQPFSDGASCRRTSLMAALVNGRCVVTTVGFLSEPFWSEGHVAAVPAGDPAAFVAAVVDCLKDSAKRERLGRLGEALYAERFEIRHTVDRLLEAEGAVAPS